MRKIEYNEAFGLVLHFGEGYTHIRDIGIAHFVLEPGWIWRLWIFVDMVYFFSCFFVHTNSSMQFTTLHI